MLLKEFSKKISTETLNGNLAQKFGTKIDVSKFTTEQLEDARNKIIKIHSKTMNISKGVNYRKLAAETDGFSMIKSYLLVITFYGHNLFAVVS